MFPGRIILLAPNLARPFPAAPPGAPTRPACGMSGFWIQQVGLHRISVVCACEESFSTIAFYPREGKRCGGLLGASTRRRPVPPGPAPPCCPAVRRPDPTRPLCVRVLDSTGVLSFVRASGKMFRIFGYDAEEGQRDGCFLGEQIRGRPVLPRPAVPRRPAMSRPAATRPWNSRTISEFWIRQICKVKNYIPGHRKQQS